jgi:hypothetical protein
MFPLTDTSTRKCIFWDSCRAHISKAVKAHFNSHRIKMFVILGGLTLYLQAGDIRIYQEFKDCLCNLIDQ